MRCFFHIGYNGFNYHGWQRQSEYLSIQQVLEENLSKILKEPVTILGCGRTDAQVHAAQYFFHLDNKDKLGPDSYRDDLRFRLNKMLPADIAVFDIIPVAENSHAQYDAKQRTYDYFIHTYKDPFLNNVSSFYQENNLNLNKMKEAVSLLTKHTDYRAFCKSPDQYLPRGINIQRGKHTNCNISSAKLLSDSKGEKLRFQISSDRFLHGMIRAIVAKLLKVGSDEMSPEQFEEMLDFKTLNSKPKTLNQLEFAYPHGLYLSKVVYPFLDISTRTEFSCIFQNITEKEWITV